MKAFIIFKEGNDVLYFTGDEPFKLHVLHQSRKLGIIAEDAGLDFLDGYVILQLFSPIVASQQVMKSQLKNPYSHLVTEEGLSIVLEQFADCMYLGIDQSDDALVVRRQLCTLHQLVLLFHGPCTTRLRPDVQHDRVLTWEQLDQVFEVYTRLANSEHAFLLEAVERLHTNGQVRNITQQCVTQALQDLKTLEKYPRHALLCVGAKVLAYQRSGNIDAMSSSDQLLLLALLNAYFKFDASVTHQDTVLSPRTISSISSLRHRKKPVKIGEKINFPSLYSETESFSEFDQSVSENRSSSSLIPEDSAVETDIFSDEPLIGPGVSSEEEGCGYPPVTVVTSQQHSQLRRENSEVSESFPSLSSLVEDVSSLQLNEAAAGPQYTWHSLPVMLGYPGLLIPHTAYLLRITDSIGLLVLCQMPGWQYAGALSPALRCVQSLLYSDGSAQTGRFVEQEFGSCIKKLKDLLKKQKEKVPRLFQLVNSVSSQWTSLKQKGLLAKVDNLVQEPLSVEVESQLSSVETNLRQLFELLFLRPTARWEEGLLHQLCSSIHDQLLDYLPYIYIKMRNNISMATYVSEYPGLIHFMFVNRTNNLLVAPTIDDSEHLIPALRQQVWREYNWFRDQLAKGKQSMLVRRGDLCFSFFLWFEDSSGGLPLVATTPYGGIPATEALESVRFYAWLLRHCFGLSHNVRCLELVCIHSAIVPTQQVLKHSRQLAQQLWQGLGTAALRL